MRALALLACGILLAFSSGTVAAQTATPTPAPPAQNTADRVKRWFEIDQLLISSRYHFIENDNNSKAANNAQYQFLGRFRFKFDSKGRYAIAVGVGTGPTITTQWNSTGWGTGRTQRDFNVRQLFFDAKPNKHVEVQVGGLYVNYGENTEALTFDNDAYITGERLQIRAPKKLYFDEVSITFARLADLLTPNVFDRFRRFDKQNYHQFLLRKQVNKIVSFSADYTFLSGQDTLHQAVKFKIPKGHPIDTFLFENYERLDPDKSYGMNVFAEKALTKRFTLSGGFADVHIPALNADRFPPGKRVYFNGIYKFTREFSLTTQFTQGVGEIRPNIARTRLDVTLSYNFLETLKRTKYF